MNKEEKTIDLNFMENIVSPPCVILSELIAIYFAYKSRDGVLPDSLFAWIMFLGETLLYLLGVLCVVLFVMLLATLVVGGIFPNIDFKYIGIAIEIIVFILALLFMPSFTKSERLNNEDKCLVSGDGIYHTLECPIVTGTDYFTFMTKSDAINEGYIPCKECNP